MSFDFSKYLLADKVTASIDLHSYVKDNLLKTPLDALPHYTQRVIHVNNLIEDYFVIFAEAPKSSILYHMSNYIMLEDIKSKSAHKSKQENAFLSPRQMRTRCIKELSVEADGLSIANVKRTHNIAKPRFTGNYEE